MGNKLKWYERFILWLEDTPEEIAEREAKRWGRIKKKDKKRRDRDERMQRRLELNLKTK